ncbi:MAG: serine hydrolase domain-containing protein [Planctomycetota bacterium]|nr:serine hydrolase domain-containing protein [Planctomycetota bacterium]
MKKIARTFVYCLITLTLFAPRAWSQGLAETTPRSVGLSQERLAGITALMQKNVDERMLGGAVAVVARRGKVAYLESVGKQNIETGVDMSTNTIFRIASMTKPITSVAVMILYDDGLIRLNDPVSKYIPEFDKPTVLRPGQEGRKTVPARRKITIKHLLTHTSGLTYHWNARLGSLYKEAGITHGLLQDDSVLGEKMKKLARIPLLHQPGEAWTYGLSVDVLGRVVEVASGKTLEEFLEERIFEPLAMKDTHFFIPDEKMSRLAAVYAPRFDGGLRRLGSKSVEEGSLVYSADHPYAGQRKYFSGGGGLCSTIGDYLRFSQMLLNEGELDGKRLLKRRTVRLMIKDHVGKLSKDQGFGLGVSVTRDAVESGGLDSVGSFGWGGFWYTTFFVDPDKKMIGICMGQLHPSGDATLNKEFKGLVYKALLN